MIGQQKNFREMNNDVEELLPLSYSDLDDDEGNDMSSTEVILTPYQRAYRIKQEPGTYNFDKMDESVVKQKRKRLPLTPEARDRRNQKRRVVNKDYRHVLRSDVRRNYAKMFINVLNASDCLLFRKFLSTFGTADIHLVDFVPEMASIGLPPLVYEKGLDNVINYWIWKTWMVPDFICQMTNIQLLVALTANCSKMVCKAIIKGTKIVKSDISKVDLEIMDTLMYNLSPSDSDTSSCGISESDDSLHQVSRSSCDILLRHKDAKINTSKTIVKCEQEFILPIRDQSKLGKINELLQHRKYWSIDSRGSSQILGPPVKFSYEGSFVLHLDDQYRIHRLEILSAQANKLK